MGRGENYDRDRCVTDSRVKQVKRKRARKTDTEVGGEGEGKERVKGSGRQTQADKSREWNLRYSCLSRHI